MRNITKILVIAALFGILLSGCNSQNSPVSPQQTKPNVQAVIPGLTSPEIPKPQKLEIQLNLPEEFYAYTGMDVANGYDLLYSNGKMGIGAIRIPMQTVYTLEEYAVQDAEYYRTELTEKDGFWMLTYEDLEWNEPHTMVNVYYETEQNFWIVQSYCPSEDYALYETEIWQYLTGATFAGE